MIAPQLLRKDLDTVKLALKRRGMDVNFTPYKDLEERRKTLQLDTESCQMKSNQLSKEVAMLKQQGKSADTLLAALKDIASEKKNLESELRTLQADIRAFELSLPNILDERVAEGSTEDDNVVISVEGTIPMFDFEPKSHTDLCGEQLDFERAAKVSGSRFVFMKSDVAKLHRALGQWMLDEQVGKGYLEINPPVLVEPHALYGTGQLPKFEDDQFFTQGSHALIPTAEVSLTNLYRDEIVPYQHLPIKLTALTSCFRKEAGAYGKDSHGLTRMHQFEKVELVQFVSPDQAEHAFQGLVDDAEDILRKLELPYRKVLLCAGDTGFSSAITYDFEVWLPSENRYREISSCSYFSDFQSRRMNARFRDEDRKNHLLHTINGSGLAVGRTLMAVLEHYQTEHGEVKIPDVLQPYMAGMSVIKFKERS